MKKKIHLIDIDYRIIEGDCFLRLFGLDSTGEIIKAVENNFNPYFYVVPVKDAEEIKEEILGSEFYEEEEKLSVEDVEVVERELDREKKEVLKVEAAKPPSIPKLRKKIKKMGGVEHCREFDIPFYKRFLIDNQIKPLKTIELEVEELEARDADFRVKSIDNDVEEINPSYNKLAFDLEVFQDEIIMASFYSEGFQKVISTAEIDNEFVEKVDSEENLIERFKEIIKDFDTDIILGYNTDEFDFHVLRERAEENGLELDIGIDGEKMKFNRRGRFSSARVKGRMHIDLYPFIEHILSPSLEAERLDLNSVAEELLGETKDEMSWAEMKESWKSKENLDEFADYCLKDSKLAFKLGNEIVPQIKQLSILTGLIPFDVCRLTYGQLTENYLLREAYSRDKLAPNRPVRDERRKRRRKGGYEGGFVYTPEAGIHEELALFDFKSLYPTVMVAHNISPEKLGLTDCEDSFRIEELEYEFCQDEQGFFPELVEDLVRKRSKIKEKMKDVEKDSDRYSYLNSRQKAQKILSNSFYGYLGYDGARWYSKECAEATTFLGREYIEDTIELAQEKGYEVVYGDTDSVFLKKENIKEDISRFLEQVNSNLPEFMQLEFEGYFKRGFFTSTDDGKGAKKKYALIDQNDDLKITGFEQVRRDWSPLAKETQKNILEKVLNKDIKEASEYVKEVIKELKSGEVPLEKLRIYTTLNKKPENYDSTAPHVEAAKKALDRGDEISPGETIDYVVTKGPGSISSRAELTKYAEDYDPQYYIENQIIPVSLRVLKVFDYTEGQLKGKGRQSGLEKF